MSTEPRSVLVFGVTGPQGRGVVEALARASEQGHQAYRILAVTRDITTLAARTVGKMPGVELVQGGFDNLEELFAREPWGVFLVQNAFIGDEVADGKRAIDLAVKYHVQHLVYTSVDFAGVNPTPIPYFETKREIENHLKASPSPLKWTIIRPTRIMDNWLRPDYVGPMMVEFAPHIEYRLISAADIGRVAVEALSNGDRYDRQIIELAADSLTTRQIADVWERVRGQRLELGRKEDIPDAFVKTMKFNAENLCSADPVECKKAFPYLLSFEDWVKKIKMVDGDLQVVM